jgi:hypothetical protein
MEVREMGNAHVTRDHLCGCGIVEAEPVEFGLNACQFSSVLFGELALRFLLGFDKLELRLQVVYLSV